MTIYCTKCGTSLPDDSKFCLKCGSALGTATSSAQQTESSAHVIASVEATQLKCPYCGASVAPKFGEMVITCEYCGNSLTLANEGWKNINKHTMLQLEMVEKDKLLAKIQTMMDKGFLHRHLQEKSTLEELNLSFVPYWIMPVSARTTIVATDTTAEVGTIATTAALLGVMAGGMGGRRRGFGPGGGLLEGAMVGTMIGGTGGGNVRKTHQLDENYNFPIVALKALTEYQPRDYQFALQQRTLFDVSKIPKGTKILNGDVSEEAAKYQAKTLVDQLQSQKAHAQHHMIQQIDTQSDVAEGELLHAPIWFARYDHKGSKIVLVIDGNSGFAINSIGL